MSAFWVTMGIWIYVSVSIASSLHNSHCLHVFFSNDHMTSSLVSMFSSYLWLHNQHVCWDVSLDSIRPHRFCSTSTVLLCIDLFSKPQCACVCLWFYPLFLKILLYVYLVACCEFLHVFVCSLAASFCIRLFCTSHVFAFYIF